jgi:two-component system NtrC family response regulator
MIRIAVAGTLAEHLAYFRTAKLRTSAVWVSLSDLAAEQQQDIIIQLKGDHTAERDLLRLGERNPALTSVVSAWPVLPTATKLDEAIQNSLNDVYGFVVGYSPAMHEACRWIRAVAHQASAALDLRTLVIGETGTGKELIARAVHKLGRSKGEPFVALNCGAFPGELIDSELFGHKRGAFTSAVTNRAGALQRASRGILFLDEIGDMPINLQAKFLRVLEQRSFSPVGSDESHSLQAQIVSATNHRLDESVKENKFRADLYFRLAQLTVALPPLRERREDIPLLVEMFLRRHELTSEVLDIKVISNMQEHDWPGNIRELRSTVDRFVLLWRSGAIEDTANLLTIMPVKAKSETHKLGTLAELRDAFDRQVLSEVLTRCGGNTKLAAAELGITQRSIYNLAHRHNIKLKRKDGN